MATSDIPGDKGWCYYSRIDNSYFTRYGMEEIFKMLLGRGITEQLQTAYKDGHVVSLGFNPKEKKWYGWSHRAIYGFTIGSECKKGMCHYRAYDKEDFRDDCVRFWIDEQHKDVQAVEHTDEHGTQGVLTEWRYGDDIPNESIRGKITGVFTEYPEEYGKGEWTAETISDAKQMAIDFSNAVA